MFNFIVGKLCDPDTLIPMTNLKTFLSFGASALILSACGHPNAMPSGYTHHHDNYKSINEPFTDVIPTISNEDTVLSFSDIDRAVDDMLRKITARAGVSPKPVYVLKPSQSSPFYSAVDSALRTSMRDLGYAISDIETGAYGFSYSARKLRKPRGTENDGHPNVELLLQVFSKVGSDAKLLTEQSGNYFIEGASSYKIKPLASANNFVPEKVTAPVIQTKVPVTIPKTSAAPIPYKREDIIIEGPEDFAPRKILAPVSAPKLAIVPDINFKSLSSADISDAYDNRPIVNERSSAIAGKVSKPVDY